MTGMVRKALTIAAGLAVVASVAAAGVPDSRNSTAESYIMGGSSGAALPSAQAVPGFDVVVRDVNNTGLVGRTVSLDFSGTPIKVYNQAFQNSGTTVNATTCVASRVTVAGGAVNFALRFGLYENTSSVDVSCDGVPLATVKARSTDTDGLGATTDIADFAEFVADYLDPALNVESDYDDNGVDDVSDYADFVGEYLSSAVGSYCP